VATLVKLWTNALGIRQPPTARRRKERS
jgi:hypothetical protein